MNQFTKGPYLVSHGNFIYAEDTERLFAGKTLVKPNRFHASLSKGTDCPQEEFDATVKLFKAAPDLYEALQAMLEFPNAGPSHDMARAALSKATA